VRITGGVHRSRALRAPRGVTTRPTSDRVREALFSILTAAGLIGGDLEPRVLDLYAGSGALSFEALSRGASRAVLVEHARDAILAIRDNARALDLEDRITIVGGRVERSLETIEGPFDLVFLDPPYADVKTRGFGNVLAAAAKLVEQDGALILEHAAQDAAPNIAGLVLDRARKHGDSALSLFRRGPSA
jgi:16S rRNA (guanine966-N2)-methyltransferase